MERRFFHLFQSGVILSRNHSNLSHIFVFPVSSIVLFPGSLACLLDQIHGTDGLPGKEKEKE